MYIGRHGYDMSVVANLMDDELREQLHGTIEDPQEFVDAYREAHVEKFGEEFCVD